MPDRRDPHGLPTVGELIDDPVGPDAQGEEATKPTAQRMTGARIALEVPEGALDRIDKRPIELEQVSPRPPGENDPGHGSVAASALGELVAQIVQRHGLLP